MSRFLVVLLAAGTAAASSSSASASTAAAATATATATSTTERRQRQSVSLPAAETSRLQQHHLTLCVSNLARLSTIIERRSVFGSLRKQSLPARRSTQQKFSTFSRAAMRRSRRLACVPAIERSNLSIERQQSTIVFDGEKPRLARVVDSRDSVLADRG